jgi:hypothetical protein
MRSNTDQQVDEKIHHFLARKSPVKTMSKTIADWLVPVSIKKHRDGISYEPMQWDSDRVLHSH